jgi:hypothetical protein
MPSRKTSPEQSKSANGGAPMTRQKMRAEGDNQRARASGGGLRSEPIDSPPGKSASTGGRASKSMVRNSLNSRSSNSGNQSGKGYRGSK